MCLDRRVCTSFTFHFFILFWDESELKIGHRQSYYSRLNETGVLDISNCNRELIETFSEFVEEVYLENRTYLYPFHRPVFSAGEL